MARGNNSGNGSNADYRMAPTASGKIMAPYGINTANKPQKQQGGDLRMKGKNTGATGNR